MNKNGDLQQPIKYKDVQGPLMACGSRNAGRLLKELADKKDDIREPTAWLLAAANRRTGPPDPWTMMMNGGAVDTKKISKTVGWLNKNLDLPAPIKYNAVSASLQRMGQTA